MQDLEHNMDDLFRKAAEEYPLKPPADEWDKISTRVVYPAISAKLKKKDKRRLLFFLLLLPFVFGGWWFLFVGGENNIEGASPDSNRTLDPKSGSVVKPLDAVIESATKSPSSSNLSIAEGMKTSQHDRNTTSPKSPSTSWLAETGTQVTNKIDSDAKITSHDLIYGRQIKYQALPAADNSIAKRIASDKIELLHPNHVSPASGLQRLQGSRSQGLYYGIALGPVFNAVESQSMTKTGYSIGLIAGYNFNRKWSIETGILHSKKYYWTDGKYFSMEKISASMPQGMDVMAVDGSSSFLEWPLRVRYSIAGNNKRSVGLAGGITTIMMINENNGYHTLFNGVEKMMYGSYQEDKVYFAAVLDFRASYRQSIGNKFYLGVEPFIQIPTKGIGMGDLRVTGAGLHIILTRKTH